MRVFHIEAMTTTTKELHECQIRGKRVVSEVDAMMKIDRMDNRSLFTSHYTRDGLRTLCGLDLQGRKQSWCANGFCRRCEKIATRCPIQAIGSVSGVKA